VYPGYHDGMPDRRTFLLGLAALPLTPATAAPNVPTDGLWVGSPGAAQLVPFRNPRWRPLANDNARFQLELEVPRPADGYPPATLRRGTASWENDGQGGDASRWTVSFTLDRADAQALVGWIGGALRDRVPLGQGLVATFAHAGGSRVSMTLVNRGEAGVGVQLGGRNRGPRDDQWAFVVQRDGVPVPPIEAFNFGGLSQITFLAPGASLTREVDAAGWADCAPRGRYVVACRWEASLVPGPSFPTEPHEWWDAAFEGTVSWG
jgi:hypothetical protein